MPWNTPQMKRVNTCIDTSAPIVDTNRCFLKVLSRIFDLLGILGPILIVEILIFQSSWIKKHD